jgi:uncharacterized membrane protein (DUF4010 family)
MKSGSIALFIVGLLLFLAGLTFTLQGYGLVGPSSSAMFQNKTWIYIGSFVLVLGLLIAFLSLRRTMKASSTADQMKTG